MAHWVEGVQAFGEFEKGAGGLVHAFSIVALIFTLFLSIYLILSIYPCYGSVEVAVCPLLILHGNGAKAKAAGSVQFMYPTEV